MERILIESLFDLPKWWLTVAMDDVFEVGDKGLDLPCAEGLQRWRVAGMAIDQNDDLERVEDVVDCLIDAACHRADIVRTDIYWILDDVENLLADGRGALIALSATQVAALCYVYRIVCVRSGHIYPLITDRLLQRLLPRLNQD